MNADITALIPTWQAAWPDALAAWSPYTRLRDPLLCTSTKQAEAEGLDGSFAMIRLVDQRVVIDLERIHALGLDDLPCPILAHEIGHHILAPANATDHVRLMARMRAALPQIEWQAPYVANLYADLFINDRLQRQADLPMVEIYRRLRRQSPESGNALWQVYMGIYETLWRETPGALGGGIDEAPRGDAWLGARLIRVYARDWLDGAGRFASLLLPYIARLGHEALPARLVLEHDTARAAEGALPHGIIHIDPAELEGAIHPARDPAIAGRTASDDATTPPSRQADRSATGQMREPADCAAILHAAGITLDRHTLAMRYYRERALPSLVPFPVKPRPHTSEPELEGLETWQIGDNPDDIDWLQSVFTSPRIIPGQTTMRRIHAQAPGDAFRPAPMDLDLYVDSSGSMPNPAVYISWPALAGTILALSALRAGASVQVTLWSGPGEVARTNGFIRDEDGILSVLTRHFGGTTSFPLEQLRATYAQRGAQDAPVHIVHISDDGIDTLFADDEQGHAGRDIAAMALARARGGGTMALLLPDDWEEYAEGADSNWARTLKQARDEQGWDIHAVANEDHLEAFARAFARRHYDASA